MTSSGPKVYWIYLRKQISELKEDQCITQPETEKKISVCGGRGIHKDHSI